MVSTRNRWRYTALCCVAVSSILFLALRPAGAETITTTQGAVADTFISLPRPTSSFGNETAMEVNGLFTSSAQYMLLDFGVVSDPNSVTSASVSLHSFYKSTDKAFVNYLISDFDNSTTWNSFHQSHQVGSRLSEFTVPAAGSRASFDVTNAAKLGRVRLIIYAGGSVRSTFATRENGDSTKRPVLTISRGGSTPTTQAPTSTTQPTYSSTTSTTKATNSTVTTAPPSNGLPVGAGNADGPSTDLKYVVFNDDFNGPLNTNNWTSGWARLSDNDPPVQQSRELACYQPGQIQFNSGILNMVAERRSGLSCGTGTREFVSGHMVSAYKKEFNAGFFEARIKLPARSDGKLYNWPAWWLDDYAWTHEIDIMEGLSGNPRGNIHRCSESRLGGVSYGNQATASAWHTYAIDWHNGMVTSYYDGKKIGSGPCDHNVKVFMAIGNQMSNENDLGGPKMPTDVASQSMQVDYIKVFCRSSSACSVTPKAR